MVKSWLYFAHRTFFYSLPMTEIQTHSRVRLVTERTSIDWTSWPADRRLMMSMTNIQDQVQVQKIFKRLKLSGFTSRIFDSFWFTLVTQMSHLPMELDEEKNLNWVTMQTIATTNVTPGLFNDWFTGHLNFQIEHQWVTARISSVREGNVFS